MWFLALVCVCEREREKERERYCVCYQHKLKRNNIKKLKFDIQNLYHIEMLLETFYEDRSHNMSTETVKIIHIRKGLWVEFLVNAF